MNTILLGGSGFLGPQILSQYPYIISVGRSKPITAVKHIDCPTVNDFDKALADIEFDKVIMMIGSSNHHVLNSNKLLAIEKNVLPLKKVFDTLRKYNIKKLISFTSILLYDREQMTLPVAESQQINPYQNEYIFSKYLAEEVASFYSDIPNIVARLTNIYGETTALGRPDVVNQLVEGLVFNKRASVQNTLPCRDFIYNNDAADAIVQLLDSSFTGKINLATGTMHSIGDIVDILESVSGLKIDRLQGEARGHMQFQADISLLKKVINWTPKHTLEQGLSKTYKAMAAMYG